VISRAAASRSTRLSLEVEAEVAVGSAVVEEVVMEVELVADTTEREDAHHTEVEATEARGPVAEVGTAEVVVVVDTEEDAKEAVEDMVEEETGAEAEAGDRTTAVEAVATTPKK
jgi:hypothetical protein